MAKKNYSYKPVTIYLDENDPYQKECLDLLSKINRKKSAFLGILAHEFNKKFGGKDFTSDELARYINLYCFIESGNLNLVNQGNNIPTTDDNHIAIASIQSDKSSKEEVEDEPNQDKIMSAMNFFSM